MKINKLKKILISSLVATTSMGAAVGISVGLLSTNKEQPIGALATPNTNTGGSSSNQTLPNTNTGGTNSNQIVPNTNSMNLGDGLGYQTSKLDFNNAYSFAIRQSAKTTEETNKEDLANIEYVMTIDGNTQKEGVIFLVKDNERTNELTFKPGETIKIGIQLYADYEKTHTARDLKVFGLSENIFVPSSKVENEENMFQVVMPEYANTVDKKTGKSWFYDKDTPIKVMPTFIQKSIGENNNTVDWEHGAFQNSLNGYVYEMKSDITWTSASQQIYKAFENKNINYPIDIYFYLNGHTLTLNHTELKLDIPSGWALHFYNNKLDKKAENGKYGEIVVPKGQETYLAVGGAVVMGSSVKFRMYNGVNGIHFINYEDKSLIVADVINDPEVRLGGR